MAHLKLDNYLRTFRKRVGLSQRDVAFLLGCQDDGVVSRYERGARRPSLRTLLAYGVILGAPLDELFAGTRQKVELRVRKRSQALAERMKATPGTDKGGRRLRVVSQIAHGENERSDPRK